MYAEPLWMSTKCTHFLVPNQVYEGARRLPNVRTFPFRSQGWLWKETNAIRTAKSEALSLASWGDYRAPLARFREQENLLRGHMRDGCRGRMKRKPLLRKAQPQAWVSVKDPASELPYGISPELVPTGSAGPVVSRAELIMQGLPGYESGLAETEHGASKPHVVIHGKR